MKKLSVIILAVLLTLALTAGAGLAIGALISGIGVNSANKKKSKKAEA